MVQAMGIGNVGQPGKIIKRKFRYTIQFSGPWGKVPEHYVKVAARPQLEIDELEIQFLNASTWIPGKGRWQPLNITYIDVAGSEMQGLYDWAATIYDFQTYGQKGIDLPQSERKGWAGDGLLALYDGCGAVVEKWTLKNCFIQAINFGDLDYSSNDECTIEVTVRYDKAFIVPIAGKCGVTPNGQCKGCDS